MAKPGGRACFETRRGGRGEHCEPCAATSGAPTAVSALNTDNRVCACSHLEPARNAAIAKCAVSVPRLYSRCLSLSRRAHGHLYLCVHEHEPPVFMNTTAERCVHEQERRPSWCSCTTEQPTAVHEQNADFALPTEADSRLAPTPES